MNYTDLELQVITHFNLGFNYRTAEDEIADNATALSVGELADTLGWKPATK